MPQVTIYTEGRAAGTLRWRQEGLYTLFEGALPGLSGLRRLYVFGGGRRCCLGLMEPRPEGLVLRRRWSRLEARVLPAPIAYAATEPRARPGMTREGRGAAQSGPDRAQNSPAGAQDDQEAQPRPCFLTVEGRRCLALPCALREGDKPALRLYHQDGRDYLLFRWDE